MEPIPPAEETAEVRELRAQVRALQAEVAQLRDSKYRRRDSARSGDRRADDEREEERRRDQREISDNLRDIVDRSGEEANRLMRAVAVGFLEHVRQWADELEDFTRRVDDRNRPDPDETPDDLARRLPRELTAEFLESVRRSFDFPQRGIDRMQEAYDETEDLPTRGRRGRRDPGERRQSREARVSSERRESREPREPRESHEPRVSKREITVETTKRTT